MERGTDASEYGNEMGWSEGDDLRMEKGRTSSLCVGGGDDGRVEG